MKPYQPEIDRLQAQLRVNPKDATLRDEIRELRMLQAEQMREATK